MSCIVSFFGADHKCGCSQISQCTAEKIATSHPELKVLLIHAEEKIGDDFSPNLGESIERIKPYIKGKLYDTEELLSKSNYLKNLYIIGGANELGSASIFHPDLASSFITEMKKLFDIILCDCGADLDHGLSLGSLFSADKLYIVYTQSESSIKRFEWMKCLFDKLELDTSHVIINKYTKRSPYDIKYFENRLGLQTENITTICKAEDGDMAEILEKSLLGFRNKAFSKDITILSEEILNLYTN